MKSNRYGILDAVRGFSIISMVLFHAAWDLVYIYGLNATEYRIGSRIDAPEENLAAMKAVLDSIRTHNAGQYVSDLTVSDPKNMTITTRTGIRVKLGDSGNMDNKIKWMYSAVGDLESRGEIRGTLDVSSGTKADYMPN